jgi:hypothetical protein
VIILTKFYKGFVFFVLSFCVFSGCVSLEEAAKKFWGSSIAHLERQRADALSLEVEMPLETCFEETEKIIGYFGSTVYLKDPDKRHLAAMNFKGSVDTTQVGVFFTKINEETTRVEVASMSPRLTKKVAKLVFSGLKR